MVRTDLIVPLIKVFFLTFAGLAALILAEKRWKLLSSFRAETSSALNLAIARIAIVSTLLAKIRMSQELYYSGLDKSLIIPPIGWSHVAAYVPRNPDLIAILYAAFVMFGAMAIVGLYGKLACFFTSATGFYLLTLPQLFGKINHDHNLILFGFVLAASPCCDTLSVDAILNAWKRSTRVECIGAPKDSIAYADPLKVMMVLMGLIYFFPGAWKVARLGLGWFSAENMRWTMAKKLLESPHVTFIQAWAMHHPIVLLAGTAFTPLFELGFIFAIFSRRSRALASACGLAFHNATGMLMNIRFLSLQICYVIFVDWTKVLTWIASCFKIDQIWVRQVGHHELAVLNIVSKFDWLNLVSISVPPDLTRGGGSLPNTDGPWLTVVDQTGAWMSGFEAYISIMKRIVCLWPLYFCFSFTVPRNIGISVYECLQRVRGTRDLKMGRPIETSHGNHQSGALLRLTSVAFTIGMILAGLSHSVNAWPIACYPTFDHLETGQVSELSAAAIGDNGQVYHQILSFDPKISADLSPERYDAMVEALMRQDTPVSRQRAAALVNLWREKYKYPNFKQVILYSSTYAFDSDGNLGHLVQNREITRLEKSDGLE